MPYARRVQLIRCTKGDELTEQSFSEFFLHTISDVLTSHFWRGFEE